MGRTCVFEELKKEEHGGSVEGDEGGDRAAEAVLVDYREDCEVFLRCNRKAPDMVLSMFYKDYSAVGRLARRARQQREFRGHYKDSGWIRCGSGDRQKEMDLINTCWVSYRR